MQKLLLAIFTMSLAACGSGSIDTDAVGEVWKEKNKRAGGRYAATSYRSMTCEAVEDSKTQFNCIMTMNEGYDQKLCAVKFDGDVAISKMGRFC